MVAVVIVVALIIVSGLLLIYQRAGIGPRLIERTTLRAWWWRHRPPRWYSRMRRQIDRLPVIERVRRERRL